MVNRSFEVIPFRQTPKGLGTRQCDGRYAPQVHSVTGIAASCTLAGKGIRNW
jgi:hypothetical protein